MTWKPIVVGVDFSPQAREAAQLGLRIAEQAGTTCYLVHGTRPILSALPVPAESHEGVIVALDQQVERVRGELVGYLKGAIPESALAHLEVRLGRGAGIVAEVARERNAGLVVLGGKPHGTLGRWLAGSTAHHLARSLDVPLLVTGPSAHAAGRVLVALDLSWTVQPTFEAALRFAKLMGSKLRTMHAVEPLPVVGTLPAFVGDAAYAADCEAEFNRCLEPLMEEVAVERVVRRGNAVDAIATEAIDWGADLVVVGSHGRSWIDRILIGSTTEGLLNALPTSILVVPVSPPPGEQPARWRRSRARRARRRTKQRHRDAIII